MNPYDENLDGQNEESRPEQSPAPQAPQQPSAPVQPQQDAYDSRQGYEAPPQKRSPYADSPYYNNPYTQSNSQQPRQDTWGNPTYTPKPPKQKKPKGESHWGRRVAAGITVVALVAAGSGITALCMNNRFNNEIAGIRQETDRQIGDLESKLAAASGSGVGLPAGPSGAMTPSQVYAKNVGSVVGISSTMGQNRLGQVATGTGSGFILSPDGYVATNHHVVDGATKVSVIIADGTEYPAKVVGQDPSNDVAVLKIEAQGLPAVTIGRSNDLLIGDMVVAIGNPLGELTATQTVGYICGKDRMVATGGSAINMLQTDAAINAGNSGGPLFNMKGEVVGITTAKYSGTTGSGASIEGIGFAIPINDVLGIMKDLVEHGFVTGPYLGVSVSDVDPQIASIYNIPLGAYVAEVVEGASADRAGLQPKDIILKLGEYDIKSSNDLIRALRHYKAGDKVNVVFNRSGSEHTAEMVLDEKPQQNQPSPQQEQQNPSSTPSQEEMDEFYDYFNRFFGDFFGVPHP